MMTPSSLIGHWTFEQGQETTDLTGNFPDLALDEKSIVANGKLTVDGPRSAVVSGRGNVSYSHYIGPVFTNKTIVLWLELGLSEFSEQVFSLVSAYGNGVADSDIIAFNKSNKVWSTAVRNGSANVWQGSSESQIGAQIQLAFVFEVAKDDGATTRVSAFRNGLPLGDFVASHSRNNATTTRRHVVFGSDAGLLKVRIEEARIYSIALSATEIRSLAPQRCAATVPASRPVVHLLLNDAAGAKTVLDTSGNGFHASVEGTALNGSATPPGSQGPARFVTLTSTTIKLNGTKLEIGASDFKVSLWARPRCRMCPLIGQRLDCNRDTRFWNLWLVDPGTSIYSGKGAMFEVNGINNLWQLLPDFVLDDGAWHFIECSRVGFVLTFSIDGIEILQRRVNKIEVLTSLTELWIGAWLTPGCPTILENYVGDVADVTLSIDRLPYLICENSTTAAPATLPSLSPSSTTPPQSTTSVSSTTNTNTTDTTSIQGQSTDVTAVTVALDDNSPTIGVGAGIGIGIAIGIVAMLLIVAIVLAARRKSSSKSTPSSAAEPATASTSEVYSSSVQGPVRNNTSNSNTYSALTPQEAELTNRN